MGKIAEKFPNFFFSSNIEAFKVIVSLSMLNICEVNVYIVMMIVKIIVVDRYSRIRLIARINWKKSPFG